MAEKNVCISPSFFGPSSVVLWLVCLSLFLLNLMRIESSRRCHCLGVRGHTRRATEYKGSRQTWLRLPLPFRCAVPLALGTVAPCYRERQFPTKRCLIGLLRPRGGGTAFPGTWAFSPYSFACPANGGRSQGQPGSLRTQQWIWPGEEVRALEAH